MSEPRHIPGSKTPEQLADDTAKKDRLAQSEKVAREADESFREQTDG